MEGHLSTRGWVVQEQVRSARTLYFGATGIAWECLNSQVCKRQLEPESDKGSSKHYSDGFYFPVIEAFDLSNPSKYFRSFYKWWTLLLKRCTGCSLTEEKDRLAAFYGIISATQKRTGLNSITGMWKELLPAELLLYSVADDCSSINARQQPSYRTPSWSWVSTNNAIGNALVDFILTLSVGPLPWKVNILSTTEECQGSFRLNSNHHLRLKGSLSQIKKAFLKARMLETRRSELEDPDRWVYRIIRRVKKYTCC
jgi:hypothetical protein